ncbi:hypothetical protein ACFSCZ_05465 [Siminovitchia sediminis]|uniref:Succinate dehydrogenase cytochrome b556 subunit n=1 Tax=Siminovitchia sediminis TaxID=1274353 RepID=A0ABW4KDD7_9BACI
MEQYPEVKIKQIPHVGYIAWLIQRITALLLVVLIPLQLFSGFALAGKISYNSFLAAIHSHPLTNLLLVFSVTFHALYGLRVILIDLGIVKDNRDVFTVLTILASVICAVFLYIILF